VNSIRVDALKWNQTISNNAAAKPLQLEPSFNQPVDSAAVASPSAESRSKSQKRKFESTQVQLPAAPGPNSETPSPAKAENISVPLTLFLEEAKPPEQCSSAAASWAPSYRKEIDSLSDFLQVAAAQGAKAGAKVTEPRADIFEKKVEELWTTLNSDEMKLRTASDPYLKPLLTQTISNLKHVRLDFTRRDEDYVHKDVIAGPYPYLPTLQAVKNVQDFYRILDGSEATEVQASVSPGQLQTEVSDIETRQKNYVKGIVDKPLEAYENFRERLQLGGEKAKFPEFADMIRYLELHMDREGPVSEASGNRHLAVARQIAKEDLQKVKSEGFPYGDTIESVQGSLAFLDMYERGRPGSEARPNLYHSDRYQYYQHFIKHECPEHVLFPTIYGLGATDLLNTRGVPIGFVGVPPTVSWVDGYTQTPLEFFYHDINHVRRMWQFTQEQAAEMKVPLPDFVREANRYVKEDLMPLIKLEKTDTLEQKNEKRMMKLIMFEAMHEDALPAHPAVLKRSLERAPNTMTPFEEQINDKKTVRYLMEPGATTLAYVYRKAAGMFYDTPGMRLDFVVGANHRSQENVAEAAKTLSRKLGLGVSEQLIDDYTRDDTGMPDDFRFQLEQQLNEDPNRMVPLKMTEDPSGKLRKRGA
jgi:hypothetical protein